MTKVLIDADPIVWAVGCVVKDDPIENALHTVKLKLNDIIEKSGADSYDIFLTGGGNFRKDVHDSYKANRDDGDRPYHFDAIRQYMVDVWGGTIYEGVEADDAIGLASTADDSTIICSIDKDLDQLPGVHYNYNKNSIYEVSYEQGMHFFFKQMLMGDRADNIGGIKGVGPKTAEKLLQGLSEAEKRCCVGLQYAIHFDDPEEMYVRNSLLLWILR